jgi:ADP-ribosylglycohydrolase
LRPLLRRIEKVHRFHPAHAVLRGSFFLIRNGDARIESFRHTAYAGGDTDSVGVISGTWVDSLHGAEELLRYLDKNLWSKPFRIKRPRKVANGLSRHQQGETSIKIGFS